MAIRVAVPFQVMVVIAKGEHDMMTKRKGDTCSASDVTVAVKVMMASRQKSMQKSNDCSNPNKAILAKRPEVTRVRCRLTDMAR